MEVSSRDFDRYEWGVTYTTDGGVEWHTELFDSREGAQTFLRMALDKNGGNDLFLYFVDRKVLISPSDLLDESLPSSQVRVLLGGTQFRAVGADEVDISRGELESVRQVVQYAASTAEYATGDTPMARDLRKADAVLRGALYGEE